MQSLRGYRCRDISIHAPLRERPASTLVLSNSFSISIHAPLRERLKLICPLLRLVHFNPRSLAGATFCFNLFISKSGNFNPRSLAGATAEVMVLARALPFQSTLPCGSDLVPLLTLILAVNFNPRSLAGATASSVLQAASAKISIHAPLRERPMIGLIRVATRAFQSTLPCGSDP